MPVSGIAQDTLPKPRKTPDYDTSYISAYTNILCVTLQGTRNNLLLDVINPNNSNQIINYSSNSPHAMGIGIDYKWLTLELMHPNPFKQELKGEKGRTEVRSIGFGITKQTWWFKTYLRTFKGVYWSNVESYFPGYLKIAKSYPQRNDFSNSVLYAGGYFSFNHKKYSHMASLWQLHQQKKSAGSFVLGASTVLYASTADSSMVPSYLLPSFGKDQSIVNSYTSNYTFSAGYVHTFVYKKKFFLHLGIMPGISLQNNTSFLTDGSKKSYRAEWGSSTEARFAAGYNSHRYFWGISTESYIFSGDLQKGGVLQYGYGYFRVFAGKRFNVHLW